jgi:hypothetical protein
MITGGDTLDIEGNIRSFMSDRGPDARYASFDYCFNYFQSFREGSRTADIAAPENILLSCFHLGFFLASWGMFRGSSELPRRSVRQFGSVIELVATMPPEFWQIDANCYSPSVCKLLVDIAKDIEKALHYPDNTWPTSTLATKIMLGIFGSPPAFDSRVVAGLRKNGHTGRFGPRALRDIGRFYADHHEVVDRYREPTLDATAGKPTRRLYTRAKVIDQIFFIEGGGSVTTL